MSAESELVSQDTNTVEEVATPAACMGLPEKITKQEVNQLPLARFSGRIHIVTTQAAVKVAVQSLSQCQILGFDTESRPSFRKGDNFLPTVVQFSDASDAYLFQIGRIGGIDGVKLLLENPDILKVGVALHDDVKRLKEIDAFSPSGITEIATLSKALGIENTGLRSLVAIILGQRISKGAQVSNWAKQTLSQGQLAYAATDAWTSHQLYVRLLELTDQARAEGLELLCPKPKKAPKPRRPKKAPKEEDAMSETQERPD